MDDPTAAGRTAGTDGPIDLTIRRSYFFDDGLMFECLRCGECCTGEPGTIYVGPGEIAPIAGHCRLSVAEVIAAYMYPFRDSYSIREDEKGHCLFFRDGCTIYEVRPLQCRTFPFWFSNLRSRSQWDRLQQQCPGIGRGRRHTKEEIMALARITTHL